jgi:hypothetical protein
MCVRQQQDVLTSSQCWVGYQQRETKLLPISSNSEWFCFLDLNYLEESSDSPELTVAILPRTGKVNLMSMESRLHVDMLESVASLATQGCEQIHTILDAVVRETTHRLKDSLLH